MLSIYLHIPFCEKKCNYCSFYIVPQNQVDQQLLESMKDNYLKNLKKEILDKKKEFSLNKEEVYTIYFGG
jgi:oxygen-independent coproporphyrinogen-3 oxidase